MVGEQGAPATRLWARAAFFAALSGLLLSWNFHWVTGIDVFTGPLGQSEAEVRAFQRAMEQRHPGGEAAQVTRRLLDGGSATGKELLRLVDKHLTSWAEAHGSTERRAWTAAVTIGWIWQTLGLVLLVMVVFAGRLGVAPVWVRALIVLAGLVPLIGAGLLALGAPPGSAEGLAEALLSQGPGVPMLLIGGAFAVPAGLGLARGRYVSTALLALTLLAAVVGGAFAWVRAT